MSSADSPATSASGTSAAGGYSVSSTWTSLFWILLVTTNIQLSLTFEFGSGGSVRWLHLFYTLAALAAMQDIRRIRLNPAWAFFGASVLFNIIAYTRYGFNLKQNFRFEVLLFSMMYFFVGGAVARRLPYDVMLKNLRRFLVIYFAVIVVRNLFWMFEYGANLYGIPYIEQNTFIIGGPNSETMWLAALSMAFLDAGFVYPSSLVLAFSQLFRSRGTFVLWALGVFVAIARPMVGVIKRRGLRWFLPMLVTLIAVCGLLGFGVASLHLPVFERFAKFGGAKDSGTGRLVVWLSGYIMLKQNLWGYGIGNVMPRVYAMWSGINLLKPGLSNTENLYLQIALEAGVVALGLYLWMIFTTIRDFARNRHFPQLFFLMIFYWVFENLGGGGGNDPMFWLAAGMYFAYAQLDKEAGSATRRAQEGG